MHATHGTRRKVARGRTSIAEKSKVPKPASLNEGEPFEGWRLPGLDYPSFRLTIVAKLINRLTAQELAQTSKLSFAEWRVLCHLAIMDGTTVRGVAAKALVDRAEVSRAMARLEHAGLAARRSNPADERMPIFSATKAGKRLYKTLIRERRRFHSAIGADLDDGERRIFDKALEKMMTRLLDAMVES